ncbi:MAG: integrase [Verrucomicrobia bacterium]|nr:MAG: integrase [Verrucomicrobiota bacterium]
MSRLQKAVQDYIDMRRALGFKLTEAAVGLRDFISFLKRRSASHITIPLALEWAQQNPAVQPSQWAQRLTWVRCFARYRSATDGRTQIPPWGLLPHRPRRARPYLYTEEEIQQLLEGALQLGGLRGWTYYSLFGLLCVTGLRLSEALNLRSEDIDLAEGVLTIQTGKFGKSRLVPIHASTQKVLQDYLQRRDRTFQRRLSYFLVSQRGNRLDSGQVRRTFYALSRKIGLRGPTASHGPRLHDFRHRLAVQTLVQWYRSGQDVERRLPILSTYLGHVHVSDTYWYLTACPELMGLAVKRLEKRWEGQA